MKTYTEYLQIETKKRIDFLRITEEIEKIVAQSGVKEGFILINPMHITSSIFINDAESGLLQDFKIIF